MILVADGPAQANCGDSNGHGEAGVTGIVIGLRDVYTGVRRFVEVSPLNGDIEDEGRVKLRFLNLSPDGRDLIVEGLLRVKTRF